MASISQPNVVAPTLVAPVVEPRGAAWSHLPVLDALRGFAALAVCWFHYTNAQFTEKLHYQASGKYGWLGVQIFFVISGFIIPLSLFRAGYRVKLFFRFMLKRIARLDPPYLASIVLVLFGLWLSSLTPGHAPFHVPWGRVFAHLGYFNALIGMPWLQMSYWSLAIEFQYYLAVGLTYPLLAHKGALGPIVLLAVAALGAWAGKSEAFLPHYLPLFAMGILAFRHKCLAERWWETWVALLAGFAIAGWAGGWPQACTALGTAVAILYVHLDHPVLNFFGSISYSLYLVHVFVGQVVFGLAVHWMTRMPWLSWTVQFFALPLAIGSACIFYWAVESPSRRLASLIRYSSRSRVETRA
jgi:peptidoglycan/LPS O-acetylase OafA/YrhL